MHNRTAPPQAFSGLRLDPRPRRPLFFDAPDGTYAEPRVRACARIYCDTNGTEKWYKAQVPTEHFARTGAMVCFPRDGAGLGEGGARGQCADEVGRMLAASWCCVRLRARR